VSLSGGGVDSLGGVLDYDGLRARFELFSSEREAERERKRLSDDLEALKRRERERERLRQEEEERERERAERLRRDMDAWRRYSGSARDGW
jgi:membrane protein involved in colicin uptake